MRQLLLAVDGQNMMYRGHYALVYSKTKEPLETSKGFPVAGIRGMLRILMSDVKKVGATHCGVVFDKPGGNFRYKLYPEYKGTRSRDEVSYAIEKQVVAMSYLLEAMGIRPFGIRGEEGDDITGSLATKFNKDIHSVISSRDKDFAQLVYEGNRSKGIKSTGLLLPKEDTPLYDEGIFEKFGVYPEQIIEFLMLIGDTVDNIPGVPGFAEKTASKFLQEYGTIEEILANLKKLTPAKRENISKAADKFDLTRELITIRTDRLPKLKLSSLEFQGADKAELKRLCNKLELKGMFDTLYEFAELQKG